MDTHMVREKANPLAVHCLTWSQERGEQWIDRYGDSKMFMDKTLTRDSFEVVPITRPRLSNSKSKSQGVKS